MLSFDAQGDLYLQELYDAEGTLLWRQRSEVEYYDDGNVKFCKEYIYDPGAGITGEMLSSESLYLPTEQDDEVEIYMSERIDYMEDGSKIHCVFDEKNYLISTTTYEADGSVSSVERHETEYDENGICIRQLVYINDVLDTEYCYMPLADGDSVMTKFALYNEDRTIMKLVTYEHQFDEDGNLTQETQYTDGVISYETFYAMDEDGCRFMAKEIEYDENGQIANEINYDKDGNEIG